jgi:8-amino-7-oxononanoate synthase
MQPKSFNLLENRISSNNFRELSIHEAKIDFYSNDYLGISRELSSSSSNHAGSTGSRLISGNSIVAETCEHFLADFFQFEAALVFNSGYDANLGLLSCVSSKHDTIIYDELVHASIRDGIRLSLAKSYSFKHNDLLDLRKKLALAKGDIFLVIESLYSMDGDFAPLKELLALKKEFNCHLIIDEAHACGVIGEKGKGLSHEFREEIFAKIVTFGKAYGTHGAAVLGSPKLKDFLINFARSFIYTTALPPQQYNTISDAVKRSENDALRQKLMENIQFFGACNKNSKTELNSPIQIIQLGDVELMRTLCEKLTHIGIAVKLIQSPTVPKGSERIRICLHAFNTKEEIGKLFEILDNNLP